MVFVSRKKIYPIFIIVFLIIFFGILYFVYFSQALSVDNADLELSGDGVTFKADITNNSNHVIDNIKIKIQLAGDERIFSISSLAPAEKREIIIPDIPISENLKYDVYVTSSFNRPLYTFFTLDEESIRPIKAEVFIASNMVIGSKYSYSVNLCNVSKSNLTGVYWAETVEGDYFEEKFIPREVSILINECKTLNSTLTPITPGKANMSFVLRVIGTEQNYSHTVNIQAG